MKALMENKPLTIFAGAFIVIFGATIAGAFGAPVADDKVDMLLSFLFGSGSTMALVGRKGQGV